MDIDELYNKILEVLPNAAFGLDNECQIIVYTNWYDESDGTATEDPEANHAH